MGAQRAHIVLPEDLVREIDQVVGPRGRSSFLVETARAELRRRRLLAVLESEQPIWKAKGHPELAAGADIWVRQLRRESESRTALHTLQEKTPPLHKKTPRAVRKSAR